MAKQSKTLQLMALKLGLSDEDKVLNKAAEFERLLQMKSSVNNITDTAKTVICLDLAATILRVDLDLKTAIKCSGLKGPAYTNSRKILENLLELNNDKLTVSGLCLMLQCNVQDLADNILEEYKKMAKMEVDVHLPQNICMAVYQACRINKIKVPKSKLIDKSQLKPGQWAKLDAEWSKFVDEKFAVAKKKRGRPKNIIVDEKMDVDIEHANQKEETKEPEIEPYEDWRSRILKEAYEELKKINHKQNVNMNKQIEKQTDHKQALNMNKQIKKHSEQNENLNEQESESKQTENRNKQLKISFSPRRSPRKTPQKFEPYKSPIKGQGVRLLFPL